MSELHGKYVTVNYLNQYFENESRMFIEHYDTEDYKDTVFVLGTNVFQTFESLEEKYKDKKIIIWQAEQLFVENDPDSEPFQAVGAITQSLFQVDRSKGHQIWDMDFMNAGYLKQQGISVDKIVPVKFCDSLRELNTVYGSEEIDVLFFGNINKRRAKIFNQLCYELFHHSVNVVFNFGMSLNTQKKYIEKSKIILNIHHTNEFNRQEQARIFYPLINKKCVLSETSQHNYFGGAIMESDVGGLSGAILSLLKDDNYVKQARKGFEIFKRKGARFEI